MRVLVDDQVAMSILGQKGSGLCVNLHVIHACVCPRPLVVHGCFLTERCRRVMYVNICGWIVSLFLLQ